jgi:hypothetical protein
MAYIKGRRASKQVHNLLAHMRCVPNNEAMKFTSLDEVDPASQAESEAAGKADKKDDDPDNMPNPTKGYTVIDLDGSLPDGPGVFRAPAKDAETSDSEEGVDSPPEQEIDI